MWKKILRTILLVTSSPRFSTDKYGCPRIHLLQGPFPRFHPNLKESRILHLCKRIRTRRSLAIAPSPRLLTYLTGTLRELPGWDRRARKAAQRGSQPLCSYSHKRGSQSWTSPFVSFLSPALRRAEDKLGRWCKRLWRTRCRWVFSYLLPYSVSRES